MSQSSDMIKLYSTRILGLAAQIPLTERIDAPDATVMKRSPLCGSTVTVDVNIADGKISAYGQDVKACALGQASASVLGSQVVGSSLTDIRSARDALNAMLKNDGPPPAAPFEALEVLQPAKDYKNRHASILLAYDATLEAMESLIAAA